VTAEFLDEIDLRILELLQDDGRIHRTDVAEKVGLSVPAASERMRKLEEAGYVKGYRAIVDAKKVGHDITAFIFVQSDSSTHYKAFREKATAHPDVLECHAITGDGSHLLKIRTRDTASLEKLLSQIQSWPGVRGTRTNVVLSSVKETTVVAVRHHR
jgi:Lrp/AsnC family leucine-responsive transcriptional regulator